MDKRNGSAFKIAHSIVHRLIAAGYKAYFVGGCVRDLILYDACNADIDIATDATPEIVCKIFPRVVPIGEHFGVVIVIEEGCGFEVATFRKDIGIKNGRHPQEVEYSTEQIDASRRDFTINGLFYNPDTKQTFDYINGLYDLNQGIIRTIGDPIERFTEDYLRLLRAIRFSARFNFIIEEKTWVGLKSCVQGILHISKERIFQELSKMLAGPNPDTAFILLYNSGLLSLLMPELTALRHVEQPELFHPEGDVFIHTIKVLRYLSSSNQSTLWSGLLHDIGKPSTFEYVDSRIRFNNHQLIGAEMAKKVLTRLKAPKILVQQVYACIANHMNFINVQKMRLSTLKQFLGRATIEDELMLHKADCLASHGNIENYIFLRGKKIAFSQEMIKPPPLILGRDLLELGFIPGPIFSEILGKVFELQLEEYLVTKEQAVEWIKNTYTVQF